MIYRKTNFLLLLITLLMLINNAHASNCKKSYLDNIVSNIQRCKSEAKLASSKEICDRYLENVKICSTTKVENAYFFNIFYSPGDSAPNSYIMDYIFKSVFDEILKSINMNSEKTRITIVGHSDPLPTKSSSQFDRNNICVNTDLDKSSNACLSLTRAYFLYESFAKYMSKAPAYINNLTSIDPPCYSEYFFVRNINNALKGEVWSKLGVEKTIQTIINKSLYMTKINY